MASALDETQLHETIATQIVELLRDSLFVEVEHTSIDVVESGLLDSAMFLTLFSALERQFDIRIELRDYNLDNFRTVNRMVEFVVAKKR